MIWLVCLLNYWLLIEFLWLPFPSQIVADQLRRRSASHLVPLVMIDSNSSSAVRMAAAPYTVSSMRALDVHNSSGTEIILSSHFSPGTISYMQQPSIPLHSFHSGSPFGNQSTMNPPIGPVPTSKQSQQMHGMYSNSGFDMLGILSRLANRLVPRSRYMISHKLVASYSFYYLDQILRLILGRSIYHVVS